MRNFFKGNNKSFLKKKKAKKKFLLLPLNMFHTFTSVSIVDFENLNVSRILFYGIHEKSWIYVFQSPHCRGRELFSSFRRRIFLMPII